MQSKMVCAGCHHGIRSLQMWAHETSRHTSKPATIFPWWCCYLKEHVQCSSNGEGLMISSKELSGWLLYSGFHAGEEINTVFIQTEFIVKMICYGGWVGRRGVAGMRSCRTLNGDIHHLALPMRLSTKVNRMGTRVCCWESAGNVLCLLTVLGSEKYSKILYSN